MIIETENIYSGDNPERAVVLRYGAVELDEPYVAVETMEQPLCIEGVHEDDLVVFGNLIDEEGVTDVRGFLVVQTMGQVGLMATLDFVMQNPELQTPQLAKKFALLESEEGELAQLGIEALAPILRQRRARIHGKDA